MNTYEEAAAFQFFLTMVNCINNSAQSARMAVTLFSSNDTTYNVINHRVETILDEYLQWMLT